MKKDITAGEDCRGGVGGGREDRQRPWRRRLQQHPCTIQQFLAVPPIKSGAGCQARQAPRAALRLGHPVTPPRAPFVAADAALHHVAADAAFSKGAALAR